MAAKTRVGKPDGPLRGDFDRKRRAMVALLSRQGVTDPAVLEAVGRVPRHLFVPPEFIERAYENVPIPLDHIQTVSQPYMVALMTQLLGLHPGDKALEIGTGSAYQAAILAEMGVEVYTIEIVEWLGLAAAERLRALGYSNVHTRIGSGYEGWPDASPYDAIVVTAAPEQIPQPLIDQLRVGGRLCIPLGSSTGEQMMYVMVKQEDGSLKEYARMPVRFVPMV